MGDNVVREAWGAIGPDEAARERMWRRVEQQAAVPSPAGRWRGRRSTWVAVVAVSLAVLAGVMIPLVRGHARAPVTLTRSAGVQATWLDRAPDTMSAASLVPMTEDELLAGADLFEGTVSRIRTLHVAFSDYATDFGVIDVRVTATIRGAAGPGQTTTILLTSPIAEGVWSEDSELAGRLRVGSSALFVGRPAEDGWAGSLDGSEMFYYSDVAQYYLGDGLRWIFLQTADGVDFSAWGWPSLAASGTSGGNEVATVATMAVVEDFLRGKIG